MSRSRCFRRPWRRTRNASPASSGRRSREGRHAEARRDDRADAGRHFVKMAIAAGTRLGPYEMLSRLGAGGMGEVYRARDRKLDRDVAIKVLPQSVAADPDTLARFEREAKAVAALSHPNILSIFDFGNQDGVAYAVMELLEGETLRGKLDAGPIPQKQAVDYALQVAKGLSAAHEKGIVHRDLKPENLFVTRDGHLKILDFGLAKRVEAVAPGKETSAPTGSGHTEPGTVMGTVGYMSPEQVKGLPGRPPLGHLLVRGDPLRAALGQEGVQARDERRDDGGDPARRTAGAVGVGAKHLSGSRPHRQALPGEGPGASVPVGQRHRVQPLGAVLAGGDGQRAGRSPRRSARRDSGSRCCPSSTAAPTPTSWPWPTGSPRRS